MSGLMIFFVVSDFLLLTLPCFYLFVSFCVYLLFVVVFLFLLFLFFVLCFVFVLTCFADHKTQPLEAGKVRQPRIVVTASSVHDPDTPGGDVGSAVSAHAVSKQAGRFIFRCVFP